MSIIIMMIMIIIIIIRKCEMCDILIPAGAYSGSETERLHHSPWLCVCVCVFLSKTT